MKKIKLFVVIIYAVISGSSCAPGPTGIIEANGEGTFLVYRRQSVIGEENFGMTLIGDTLKLKSLQGENERGRVTGILAELWMTKDLEPIYYSNKRISGDDTTNI